MSGLGKKRAAEGRLDRDEVENGAVPPSTADEGSKNASSSAPAVTLAKAGPRPEDTPSYNPFKGLATSTAGAAPSVGFGAAASGTHGFSFGGFGAPSSAPSSVPSSSAPAAPMKFSFSFGAPASSTPAAAAAPSPAASAAPTTFSFNFGASSAAAAPAAPAPSSPSSTGAFNFGAKFDFNAGVKAFAAAQTASATEKKPEPEGEVDPEAEDPATIAAITTQPNALSSAAVKTDLSTGDESDEVEFEVPNTKVFLLGFKDIVGEDGKPTPSTTEKEWKERGVGTLKVNSFELGGVKCHRLLMHSSQTKQLVLNITVDKWFAVAATTEKSVNFRTVVVDAEGKPKAAMYSLRVIETAVKQLADKLREITLKKE